MPLTDTELLDLLNRTANALDAEAAWIVDVDVDDRGRSKSSIPACDRDFFDAVSETAQSLRALVEMVQARQAR